MANTVEVVFQIDRDGQGRTTLRQIDTAVDKIGVTARRTGAALDKLSAGDRVLLRKFENAAKGIEQSDKAIQKFKSNAQSASKDTEASFAVFKTAILVEFFRRGAAAAVAFGQEALQAFQKANAAKLAFEAVAASKGIKPTDASQAISQNPFVQKGLLTEPEAQASIKNLLAFGFTLEQSIELFNRFVDTAAVARQSHLSIGEAVRFTTQGIKDGVSQQADAIGISDNLSAIYKRARVSADELGNSQLKLAETTGIFNQYMGLTAPFVGQAEKSLTGLIGANAKLEAAQLKFLVAIGKQINENPKLAKTFDSLTATITSLATAVGTEGSGANKSLSTLLDLASTSVRSLDNLAQSGEAVAATFRVVFLPVIKIFDLLFGENANAKRIEQTERLINRLQIALNKAATLQSPEAVIASIQGETTRNAKAEIDRLQASATAFFERQIAETQKASDVRDSSLRDGARALAELQSQIADNPLAKLYLDADQRQAQFFNSLDDKLRSFREQFKDTNVDIISSFERGAEALKRAYRQASDDVLRLNLFSGGLTQGDKLSALLLERDKIDAGLSGKETLDDFDTQKLARIQRESLDARLRTAQEFLNLAETAQQRSLANQQILGLTNNGRLTQDQIQIRRRALDSQIQIEQQAFKENFERLKRQTNATENNTLALVAVGNRLSTVEGALTNFAQQPITIAIENETTARVDVGKANPGLKE